MFNCQLMGCCRQGEKNMARSRNSFVKNDYVILDSNRMENIRFAEPFVMRANILKYATTNGKLLSNNSSLRLSRYMRFSNVEEILGGQLRFDIPTRWADPFEKLFYKDSITIDSKKFYVACLCFIIDANDGEESLWHVHGDICTKKGDISDYRIRATFNIQALCNSLSKGNPGVTFYFAPIDYSFNREQILQQYHNRMITPYSSIEEYIDDLLIKRKAFSYEHEVRLFAVSEEPLKNISDDFCFFNLKKAKSIITSITLPPIPITSSYNKQQYHKDLESKLSPLKSAIANAGFKKVIKQSRLYDIL